MTRRLYGLFTVLFIFALVFGMASAFAKVTIKSLSGGSNIDTSASTPIVYGGTAGSAASCSGTGLCDNCTGTLTACNKRRITPTTVVSVTMSSDTLDGYPIVADDSTGAIVQDSGTSVSQGNLTTIEIPWSSICGKLDSTDCMVNSSGTTLNTSVTLRVGFDNANDDKLDGVSDDYTKISFKVQRSMAGTVDLSTGSQQYATNGIYDWSVYPGDGKVYLENLAAHDGFPSSVNIQYSKVHLFYLEGNCAQVASIVNNTSSVTADIKSDGNLGDNRFYGFTNETEYVFKVGIEDQAANLGLFYPNAPCTNDTHTAKPGEVFGLLKEEQNCFIATAAYGSKFETQVKTFREFRDKILLSFKWGQKFVNAYYKHSPQYASFIAQSDSLRSIARFLLYPLWLFSSLALKIGFWPSLLILMCLMSSLFIIMRWRRKALR